MLGKLSGWDDTIVALATAPGVSAIGVIRLSGPDSIAVVNKLFPSKNLEKQISHTLHVGMLKENGHALDEVVVSLFRAPRSYTGEEVVEISCHGSPYIQDQIIQAIMRQGARLAKPGEFTQRAFLNGKMDLAQAEAVADLIASNADASRDAALNTIKGGFSKELRLLRDRMLSFSALIELELDFSQEDVEFADRRQLNALITEAEETTKALLSSFRLGNVIRNGVQVAIVGKPNAGKSTLLNGLLQEDRAIVSEIAGTTRDTIEEVLNIDGIVFRLIDTAGIRSHSADIIEQIGIGKSLEKMQQADMVLYLFDVEEISDSDLNATRLELAGKTKPYLLVGNKTDRSGLLQAQAKFGSAPDLVYISAKQKPDLEKIKEKLSYAVLQGDVKPEGNVVTNARHYHALQQVALSLKDIRNGMINNLPGDLLASDIRRCLHFLGEITGEITNEDQLDYIFSKFCIGK